MLIVPSLTATPSVPPRTTLPPLSVIEPASTRFELFTADVSTLDTACLSITTSAGSVSRTARLTNPCPSKLTTAFVPAAKATSPPGAEMSPSLFTTGATSATLPPFVVRIVP